MYIEKPVPVVAVISKKHKGGENMSNKAFMSVDDVAEILNISKSYAYKIVRELNADLRAKGFITVSGRVNTQYFLERTCYGTAQNTERND